MSFQLSGVNSVLTKLLGVNNRVGRRIPTALRTEAELIMTDSKQNYVPRDTGGLMRSGTVHNPVRRDDVVSITLSFSGPHALAVHEVHSEHDPPSWRGTDVNFREGGPKYLERPLRAAMPGMNRRIAEHIGLL